MQRRHFTWFVASLAFLGALSHLRAADVASWPQWRGAQQNGVATGKTYPIGWSEDSGVAWKLDLPGLGGSTPVVHRSTAYLTSGIDGVNTLLAVDIDSGRIQWQTGLGNDRGAKHKKGSGSNPSPVVDGDSVYAYFRSGDLACVDATGEKQWSVNLQEKYGQDSLWWDLGSSPLLTDNAIVVAVMQTGPSYLVALDKQTGEEIWKQDRMLDAPEEAAQSYTTPLAVQIGGIDAIAVMGADHLTLHHSQNGTELGRLGGFNPNAEKYFRSIASPVAVGDIIVCPYARGATLTAVRMSELVDGKGTAAIAWFRDDLGSDVPTPAAEDGKVYVVGDGSQSKGMIQCLNAESGDTIWSVQLEKSRLGYSSSPLVAGDHLYVTREDGATFVIGPLSSGEPKIVSKNEIADTEAYTVASPVAVNGDLLLRSRNRLYRIAGE